MKYEMPSLYRMWISSDCLDFWKISWAPVSGILKSSDKNSSEDEEFVGSWESISMLTTIFYKESGRFGELQNA
jgi:hypothetical protein